VQDKVLAKQRAESDAKSRGNAREVRRAVERAESRVDELEARIARLDAELADPTLYARPNGQVLAQALSREKREAAAALTEALEVWEEAVATAEAMDVV
jgi:ATP-binding cassette, subfamily F, member 3